MVIITLDEKSIFRKLVKIQDDIAISAKYDEKFNIIVFSFCHKDTVYISKKILDSNNFLKKLKEILSNISFNIYTYNLKRIYKLFLSNNITLYKDNLKDIRILLYNIFGYSIELNSKEVENITGIKLDTALYEFLQKNTGLKGNVDYIFPRHVIDRCIQDEVAIIGKLIKYCKNNDNPDSKYYSIINHASEAYAGIELNDIKLDISNLVYTKVRRYFQDLLPSDKRARVHYNFDHASTGRIASNFHPLPHDQRNIIIPDNDNIFTIDLQCFEAKMFLSEFEIEYKHSDLYEELGKHCGIKRDDAKQQFLAYIYGSLSIDEKFSILFEKMFGLRKKIDNKLEQVTSRIIRLPVGKIIHYDTIEEARKKFVNGYIQCQAQLFMNILVIKLQEYLRLQGARSKIIATIYDEIVLDVDHEEIMILDEFEAILEEMNSYNKYVLYTPSYAIGKNLRDLDEYVRDR